ncbi:MAG: hypothetical protein QOI81_715 [Actinomycetota bacterium]|nr:hypothetical protein [Actinomycetota bacterium]
MVQLGKVLVALLAVTGLVSVIQAFQLLAERGHVRDIVITAGPDVGLRMQGVFGSQPIAGILSAVTLAAGVLWLVWQHRGHANVLAGGTQGLKYTPGWAVGWWFVPLANFVMPYLTMRELWDNAGRGGSGAPRSRDRRPITVWWFGYLVATLVMLGAFGALVPSFASWVRAAPTTAPGEFPTLTFTAAALRQFYLWTAIGDLFRALAAGLAIGVVRTISRREDAAPVPMAHELPIGWVPPRPDL